MSDSEYFDALEAINEPAGPEAPESPPWGPQSSSDDFPTPEDPDKTTEEDDIRRGAVQNVSHGEKPPWGWDYMFCFKLPRSLRRKLEREATPTSATSADDKSHAQGENFDQQEEDRKSVERIRKRVEILSRLERAGFHFSQILVPSENVILVRFSLPEPEMKRKAEEIGIELRLKDEFGGGYLAFKQERSEVFSNAEDGKVRECFFAPSDRTLIIIAVLQSRDHWGCDLNIEQLLHEETLLQAFALHSEHEHGNLVNATVWKRAWDPTYKPPLQDLKDYLGGK